jgi:FG-GAP-like repeat/FG-GAP repeat
MAMRHEESMMETRSIRPRSLPLPLAAAALAVAVLAGCSTQPGAKAAAPPPAAAPAASAPAPAADAGGATPATPEPETPGGAFLARTLPPRPQEESPEDRVWLVDENGRQYFIAKLPRYEGAYEWVDATHVRYRGPVIEIVDYDDEYFYVKSYRTEAVPAPPAPAPPTPEQVAAVAASYRVDTPEVDRLHLAFCDRGLPTSGQWRNGFVFADMNGDGILDIVHGSPRKGVGVPVVFLGDGKGGWQVWRQARFPSTYDYGDVAVADFNGDGHPDLALAIHLRGLRVLLGDGAGNFRDWSQGLDYQVPGQGGDARGYSSRTVAAVDWNGDGRPDLVAVGEGPRLAGRAQRGGLGKVALLDDGPAIFLNGGDGTWKKVEPAVGEEPPLFGDDVTVADFNGDGRLDFATASSRMGRTDLVDLAQADGSWTAEPIPEVRPNAYIRAVDAADFDGDGHPDLAVGYLSYEVETWRTGIDLLYSRPGGAWERRPLFAREGRVAVYAIGHGDLDGDGALDLVGLDGDGGVMIFLGDGHGSFVRQDAAAVDHPRGVCRGYRVRLADLDGDGRDEVVATFSDEASAYFDPNRCPSGGGIAAFEALP